MTFDLLIDWMELNAILKIIQIPGRKLNNFVRALERDHNKIFSVSEPDITYINQSPEPDTE